MTFRISSRVPPIGFPIDVTTGARPGARRWFRRS